MCREEAQVWRFAIGLLFVVPVAVHAQNEQAATRVLVPAPEGVSVADVTVADIEIDRMGER